MRHWVIIGLCFGLLLSGAVAHAAQEKVKPKAKIKKKEKFALGPAYCPVCPEQTIAGVPVPHRYKNVRFSFCSFECLQKFKQNPEFYFSNHLHELPEEFRH